MWLRLLITFLISLILFLLQQFLISSPLIINVFVILIAWLSLKQSANRWLYAFWAGLLLDLAYGTLGINLLSFFFLVYLFNIFTSQVSVYNLIARLALITGGVLFFLLINYSLSWFFNLIFASFEHYSFFLSFSDLMNYILTNSLLAILLLLIFRKKSIEISYETFN